MKGHCSWRAFSFSFSPIPLCCAVSNPQVHRVTKQCVCRGLSGRSELLEVRTNIYLVENDERLCRVLSPQQRLRICMLWKTLRSLLLSWATGHRTTGCDVICSWTWRCLGSTQYCSLILLKTAMAAYKDLCIIPPAVILLLKAFNHL